MAIRCVNKNEWTKDGRKWVFEVRSDGKTHHSKKFHTKKEAEAAAREFLIEREKKSAVFKDNKYVTVRDLMNKHDNFKEPTIKGTTKKNYINKRKHLESIADIKLCDLTVELLNNWVSELTHKDLAVRTKNDIQKYFKSCLNYGYHKLGIELLDLINTLEKIVDPNEDVKEMEFYTDEEFKIFLSYEEDYMYKCLFEVLFYCGLRRGELRGLCWNKIDFDKNQMRIDSNVVDVKSDVAYWTKTSPKNKPSIRTIPMLGPVADDLKKLKEERKKIYGFNDEWFVFGDINPIHPDRLRTHKNMIAEKAGVKQIRIHDFRHSCASFLINNNISIYKVSKFLGHSKIDETTKTYAHLYDDGLSELCDMINPIIDKKMEMA